MIENLKDANLAIVGGGRFCKAFLNTIYHKDSINKKPNILGIADINRQAVGLLFAKEKGIFTTGNYEELYAFKDLNLIIELTKDDLLGEVIKKTKPPEVGFLDHFEARALLDYLLIEEEKNKFLKKIRSNENTLEKIEGLFEHFWRFIFDIAKANDTNARPIPVYSMLFDLMAYSFAPS